MGDRYDREQSRRRRRNGGLKPPELILDWGLSPSQTKPTPQPSATIGDPPAIGHNGGPPIEQPVDLYVRHLWTAAHRAAWKTPPMDILRFRLARAEAAGVSYHDYMLALLDTGRHLQKADVSDSALTNVRSAGVIRACEEAAMPTITLRLDGETHAQLERRLARGDITQSDFVRSAIAAKLASEAADQDRFDTLLIALKDCRPTGETDLSTTYKTRIKEKLRAKHSR